MNEGITLLLASKSPRRRQLLEQLGYALRVVDVEVEERLEGPVPVSLVAERLAVLKSKGYREPLCEGEVLVTADTVVAAQQLLGKPHDKEEARHMLRLLSGRAHQVYTGVCLRTAGGEACFTEATTVHVRPLSDEVIEHS